MTQEKANRMVAAATVNVILLIVILVVVIIYQMVQITIVNKRRSELLDKIDYYNSKIEEDIGDLELLQSKEYLRDLAIEYGYRSAD